MNRGERLRRVLICSCHFTQNLAFYRAGSNNKQLTRKEEFWRRINGNCFDLAVIEWCKLFGDFSGKHCWKNIVTDKAAFSSDLFDLVGGEAYLDAYVKKVRTYRDKFVAHLDDELTANTPNMQDALIASRFYYKHIHDEAKSLGVISRLPDDIEVFYDYWYDLARSEYEKKT